MATKKDGRIIETPTEARQAETRPVCAGDTLNEYRPDGPDIGWHLVSHLQEYDFNRMVVRFTMKNDQADVACAISTDAMDQLEGSSRTPPAQRQQQFLRLRDRIEERAARKFSDVELEGNPPGVILRAIDFREARK